MGQPRLRVSSFRFLVSGFFRAQIKRDTTLPLRMGGVRYDFVRDRRRLLIRGWFLRRLFGCGCGGGFGLPEIWVGFDPLILNIADSGIE